LPYAYQVARYSRRAFVKTIGVGGAAAATAHQVAARGREALGGSWAGVSSAAAQNAATIELGSNENPNGPGPGTLSAIRDALSLVNHYPYIEAGTLTTAIARAHNVKPAQVILGCGSSEILRMAMQAFTSRARHLVGAAPTFETPGDYALSFSVPFQAVRVDANLRPNLAAMETSAQRAGVVYLCNPGNPTGTVLSARAVTGFVERLTVSSPQTAIVIDEAYHEYVDDPSYGTSIPLAVAHKNVIVSRTFSKIHGLAGLRCGYAIAHPETIGMLARYKLPTGVNQLAIAAARAALADKERVDRERAVNRETREYTRRMFESMGYSSGPSETNFILVDLRRDAQAFRESCRQAGVVVGRAFPPLSNYVRISVGTMAEMQRAAGVFRRILGKI
jgi:histidinol-phosphate aminotransferase